MGADVPLPPICDITPLEIFTGIQQSGDISTIEKCRTFNMGMGYEYVIPKASVATVLKMVNGAQVVGKVVKEPGAWLGDMEIT